MKHYYIYITTNLTNGRKYIGQHCTYDLGDGYFGSSSDLKADIKKGDKYIVHPVKYYDNIFDLGEAEYSLIKEKNAIEDAIYYNQSNPKLYNLRFEGIISDETKIKISKALKGRKASRKACKNISKRLMGNQYAKDKPCTEQRRKLISIANTGRIVSETTKKKISIANTGRIFSTEHKKKLSISQQKPKLSSDLNMKRKEDYNNHFEKYGHTEWKMLADKWNLASCSAARNYILKQNWFRNKK